MPHPGPESDRLQPIQPERKRKKGLSRRGFIGAGLAATAVALAGGLSRFLPVGKQDTRPVPKETPTPDMRWALKPAGGTETIMIKPPYKDGYNTATISIPPRSIALMYYETGSLTTRHFGHIDIRMVCNTDTTALPRELIYDFEDGIKATTITVEYYKPPANPTDSWKTLILANTARLAKKVIDPLYKPVYFVVELGKREGDGTVLFSKNYQHVESITPKSLM